MNSESKAQTRSVLLKESGTPLIFRMILYFFSTMITLSLIWASITKLEEVAVAEGKVVASSYARKIQPTIGGTVSEVNVTEGAYVKRGQVLLKMDTLVTETQLRQTGLQLGAQQLIQRRLRALLENRTPDFSGIKNCSEKDLRDQQDLYEQAHKIDELKHKEFESQIQQTEHELQELAIKEEKFSRQKSFLEEEMEIRKGLVEKGLNSKIQFLGLQRQMSDVQFELQTLPETRQKIMKKKAESEMKFAEYQSTSRQGILKELSDAIRKIEQSEQEYLRHSRSLEESVISSPIDGFVSNLTIFSTQIVITAGQTVMEILPEKDPLIAEVKITPKDIGHVVTGQPVTVKFNTYDSTRYGTIQGILKEISPSTLKDSESPEPFYRGIVYLEKNYVGNDPGKNIIFHGMTLTADIKTGSKSVLQYMLKPVVTSAKQALRER